MKHGIENLRIAVLIICQLWLNIQEIILKGKKSWLGIIIKFGKSTIKNWKFYKNFNYKLVINEIKDLDSKEIEELIYFITVNLNISNKNALEIINKSLSMIDSSFDIYKLIKK